MRLPFRHARSGWFSLKLRCGGFKGRVQTAVPWQIVNEGFRHDVRNPSPPTRAPIHHTREPKFVLAVLAAAITMPPMVAVGQSWNGLHSIQSLRIRAAGVARPWFRGHGALLRGAITRRTAVMPSCPPSPCFCASGVLPFTGNTHVRL